MLIQREKYNAKQMKIMGIPRYPDIPDGVEFQHKYGYEIPRKVYGWEWSTTFGKWSALVLFQDGWYGFSYPKPKTGENEK